MTSFLKKIAVKTKPANIQPYIINTYKPAGVSSQDVVRHFKRNLPQGFGKIGHFGTLDPFAEGVLMIGVAGAARLNEWIHSEMSKTYIAYGKLGVETQTGDLTVEPSQVDESDYIKTVIADFSPEFIEEKLSEEFLGEYWQAPHKYSAAKFEGRNLHEWARDGIEIKKEKKLKHIYSLKVIEYQFPHLVIEFEVSSGTYIRTLFSECAQHLGTLGCLEKLKRTKVGEIHANNSLHEQSWPTKDNWSYDQPGVYSVNGVISYPELRLSPEQVTKFENGNPIETDKDDKYLWAFSNEKILGLAEKREKLYWPKIVWKF